MKVAPHPIAARPGPKKPASEASDDPAIESLRRFRQIFATVRTHFRQVEQITGAGAAQLRALSLLRERPGLRISEMALAMDIHQSTASNLVKTLVDRKLVSGLRSGKDARVLHLNLLPAGEKVLQRLQGQHYIGVLPQALQTLSPRVLKRMNADLDLLLTAMQADDAAAKSPLASL
ncbi:MAG: MarR family transcriptional regulator [Hylemonella sp.]|nr:MarR family transcriptional regulator [Hylemonella sp.]